MNRYSIVSLAALGLSLAGCAQDMVQANEPDTGAVSAVSLSEQDQALYDKLLTVMHVIRAGEGCLRSHPDDAALRIIFRRYNDRFKTVTEDMLALAAEREAFTPEIRSQLSQDAQARADASVGAETPDFEACKTFAREVERDAYNP